MNAERLFRVLGDINDGWVEEAAQPGRRAAPWKRWWPVAACGVAATVVLALQAPPPPAHPYDPPPTQVVQDTFHWNRSPGKGEVLYIGIPDMEELGKKEGEALLPGLAGKGELQVTGYQQEDGSPYYIHTRLTEKEGREADIVLTTGEPWPSVEYTLGEDPILSQVGGVDVVVGYLEEADGTALYFAEFILGEVGYRVTVRGGEAEQTFLEGLVEDLIAGGEADLTLLTPDVSALRGEDQTLAQAYAHPDFGAYLPQSIPKDFAFERAMRQHNKTMDSLFVTWSKGMAYLEVRVFRLEENHRGRLTTAEAPETYDLSLYPIPRAESVPMELWEVVNCPIFPAEELTLPVLETRADRVQDAGDVGGGRFHLGVLYGEDIVVEITAKGVTTEEIFTSLTERAIPTT